MHKGMEVLPFRKIKRQVFFNERNIKIGTVFYVVRNVTVSSITLVFLFQSKNCFLWSLSSFHRC